MADVRNLGRVVGKSAYEIALDNGFKGTEQEWLESLDGKDGKNGVSPDVNVTQTSEGAVITITDANGTTTVEIHNGAKGDQGKPGKPGKDGKTPERGVDYWTESDKQAVVDDTLAALPTWNWEAV